MSLINCEKVYVSNSTVCDGLGAFAKGAFDTNDIIETGVAKVLTNCNGHENPVVFTWSDKIPNTTWAVTSGCAMFYNASNTPNTEMIRDFTRNTFTIRAIRPIQAGEELFHTYKSLRWRRCFQDIRDV